MEWFLCGDNTMFEGGVSSYVCEAKKLVEIVTNMLIVKE